MVLSSNTWYSFFIILWLEGIDISCTIIILITHVEFFFFFGLQKNRDFIT